MGKRLNKNTEILLVPVNMESDIIVNDSAAGSAENGNIFGILS